MNEFWQTNTIVNNEVCPVDVLENIKTKINIDLYMSREKTSQVSKVVFIKFTS